ncbi:MAG: penicillin-binding protein 2 [Proteobacteria bacterium]|nr:penicillin-binding protein 2 [Pseudomonadota bacterium]
MKYKHRFLHAKDHDNRLTAERALIGILFIGMMIAILLIRVAYLQITDHQKYQTLSNKNQLRLLPIAPPRGLIYDRNGKLLAKNNPAFHLAVIPDDVPDMQKMLEELNKIIPMDQEATKAFLDKVDNSPTYQRQVIKLKLTEEEVSRFAVNQFNFPGVFLMVDLIRDYPYGSLLAHVIGYVSEANKEDLHKIDKKRYAGTYQIGKSGLEKYYENHLQGVPGYQQMETDVLGREVRALATLPATAGTDLHLTIDIELQKIATEALGENKGAIVVVDPNNGEVLAMASTPSFDPNLFVRGLDNRTYSALRQESTRPLFNRAVQGQYPPGSTVKPIVALAGLNTQKINPQQKVFDPGWYQLNNTGRYYRDWQEKGHGWTDLEKSIRESCDIYYYVLAEKLGITALSNWFSDVGLGKLTGIDLPGEQKGIVPSIAWKKKTMGTVWYPGETIITGIGQGYTTATPLQLAVMASYIANHGQAYSLHLNKALAPKKLPPLKIADEKNWDVIIEPMHQVTQHPKGTASKYFNGFNIDVAGKTGTSQVFGLKQNEKYHHDKIAEHLRDHSLFIGFAPVSQPTVAIAVLLENQRASASVARVVLEKYFTEIKHAEQSEIPSTS